MRVQLVDERAVAELSGQRAEPGEKLAGTESGTER
jgi:hypothetical protein